MLVFQLRIDAFKLTHDSHPECYLSSQDQPADDRSKKTSKPFSDSLGLFSDSFGPFLDGFGSFSDGFGPFSDGFGQRWIVFGPFRTVSDRFGLFSDRFRTVFGLFRTVSDDFGAVSDRFRATPLKILKFQISIGQGWGPSVPFRPSVPSPPALAN